MTVPTFAATPYYPLYYTSSYHGAVYRQHAPFQVPSSGIAESNTTSSKGTTVALSAGPNTSAGFIVDGGELGTLASKSFNPPNGLAMVQIKGSGSITVHLWIDSNMVNDTATNGDWFSWSGALSSTASNRLTSLGGDQVFVGPTKASEPFTLNGSTVFTDSANGHTYTLNELQGSQGAALGLSSVDNVAVWVGVEGRTAGASATITDVKIDSTTVPLGQLPEVPYSAGLPLLAGAALAGLWYRKSMRRAQLA